jgi:hypothetical protein
MNIHKIDINNGRISKLQDLYVQTRWLNFLGGLI